jgi:hypothetical protein
MLLLIIALFLLNIILVTTFLPHQKLRRGLRVPTSIMKRPHPKCSRTVKSTFRFGEVFRRMRFLAKPWRQNYVFIILDHL